MLSVADYAPTVLNLLTEKISEHLTRNFTVTDKSEDYVLLLWTIFLDQGCSW